MLSWDELQKNVAIGKKPGEVLGVEVDYTRQENKYSQFYSLYRP